MKISAIILTDNKEKNINRCLRSVDFCDEKLVIEKKITDFSDARNQAMVKAKHDWILFIDDDEEVPENLKFEIKNLKFDQDAYYIKRRDFFWGRELKYGETRKLRNRGIIRLIKKNSGRWEGKVHEEFKFKNEELKVKRLDAYLNHYPHQSIKEFIEKINFYSSLRAQQLHQQGKKFCLCQAIFYPFLKFILNYFIYFGFLDGPAGFTYAFLMSFHSFLVRAKLFQLSLNYEKSKPLD